MKIPDWKKELADASEEGADAQPIRLTLGVTVREKAAEGQEGTIRFVMNGGVPDRGGDVIHHEGTWLENFAKNPVMPWGHDYRGLPLGQWANVHVDGHDLVGDADFRSREVWDFAELVYQMYRREILRACSVGIQPIVYARNEERGPWAYDFLEQDLLECSAVMIGQHQDALVVQQQAKDAGLDIRPLLREAERILEGEHGIGLWVPRSTLEAMAKSPSAPVVFDLAGDGGRELLAAVAAKTDDGDDEDAQAEGDAGEGGESDEGEFFTLNVHLRESLSIAACGVCGGRHDSLPIQVRSAAPEAPGWTHWGVCPSTGDPVHFTVSSSAQESAPEVDEDEAWLESLERTLRDSCRKAADEATTATTGELVYDDE